MNKLDKKQIPQFAALCVLSAGVFGYFVMKIVTPSPAAAGTRPHPVSAAPAATPSASPSAAKTAPAADTVVAEADAPAPTPGMRDPFVVGYVDPALQSALSPAHPAGPGKPAASPATPPKAAAAQVASIHEVGPASVGAPALPFGLKGFPPIPGAPALPVAVRPTAPDAPAAPAWTVTGVLQNDAGQVAILRSGETRRIVRTGDFVDRVYRVVAVTRSVVVLRHGQTFYHLTLGDSKAAKPAETAPAPASVPAPPRPSAPGPVRAPQTAALTPAAPAVGSEAGLVQVIQAALLLARSYMAPAQAEVEVCLTAFHARTALPSRVAMRFLAPVPSAVEARAQRQCVLTKGAPEATAGAGTLPGRYD